MKQAEIFQPAWEIADAAQWTRGLFKFSLARDEG
jgi:hypothetical protein